MQLLVLLLLLLLSLRLQCSVDSGGGGRSESTRIMMNDKNDGEEILLSNHSQKVLIINQASSLIHFVTYGTQSPQAETKSTPVWNIHKVGSHSI
jgi:hypothetical protein